MKSGELQCLVLFIARMLQCLLRESLWKKEVRDGIAEQDSNNGEALSEGDHWREGLFWKKGFQLG